MAPQVISYKGFSLNDDLDGAGGFSAGIPPDQGRGLWSIVPTTVPRYNDHGEIVGYEISDRPIPTRITYKGALTYPEAWGYLLGKINPLEKLNPGNAIGQLVVDLRAPGAPSAKLAQADAMITLPAGIPQDETINFVDVSFLTTDPCWRALTATAISPVTVPKNTYGGLTINVTGEAPVPLTVKLKPTAADQQVKVQTFTITNNATGPLVRHPLRIDFGNTDDGLSHPSFYFALLREGKLQPCQLIGYYSKKTYVWLVVDYLEPGATATYQFLISDTFLMPGTPFNSTTQPAFDTGAVFGQAAGGGHTTTLTNLAGSFGSEVNRWARGIIRMLDGPNAGLERRVTASALGGGITHAAFPVANVNGNTAWITMSSNDEWVYAVRATERNDSRRGLWWLDTGQNLPSDWRFDVPGGWAPELYTDTEDNIIQANYTRINVGTLDSFAILNAWRTWKSGTGVKGEAKGGADGVKISLPEGIPITSITLDEKLRNPAGMCKFFLGSRKVGSLGWIEEYVNAAASTSITAYAAHTVNLTAGSHQVYMGLIPGDDISGEQKESIGNEWAKDNGTSTIGDNGTVSSATSTTIVDTSKGWAAGAWNGFTVMITKGTGFGQTRTITGTTGGTTLTVAAWGTIPDSTSEYSIARRNNLDDATKNWITNQWVGATARIIRGLGAGSSAKVTANTATQLTAAFGRLIDSTSVYEVKQVDMPAIVRNGDRFEMTLNQSAIAISTPTAPVSGYILNRELFLDRATAGANPPYQRVRFTADYTGRYIVLMSGQVLAIDGGSQRAWVEDSGGNVVGTVPPRAVQVQDVAADGTARLAERWLEVTPGSHPLMLSSVGTGNQYEISASYTAAYYG